MGGRLRDHHAIGAVECCLGISGQQWKREHIEKIRAHNSDGLIESLLVHRDFAPVTTAYSSHKCTGLHDTRDIIFDVIDERKRKHRIPNVHWNDLPIGLHPLHRQPEQLVALLVKLVA